jgi:Holliday junction resolvase RusA-like endonuclease
MTISLDPSIMAVRLVLPWPDARLLPNRKLHWAVKARATIDARSEARFVSEDWRNLKARELNVRIPRPLLLSCTARVTFYPPDKRRRDLDNLLRACKPYWDGMVDAGLLVDDSCIKEISVRMGEPDKANPRTEIELEVR